MDYLLKSLSVLMSYPGPAMRAALPEVRAIVAHQPALLALTDELIAMDPFDAEERYVGLFDRSRQLSLNLFEHIHGESRDRGSAMVDLIETYRAAGFDPVTSELPDHLPVLLEFLASRPAAEVKEVLAGAAHVLGALAERLTRRDSAYAAVPAFLLRLAGAEGGTLPDEVDENPDDLAALDAIWAETEVTFGPDPNAGCPAAREVLTRMDLPMTAE
ncbi:MAG: nitrate reductase molybdenum cofactor assembly chaperone [Rhodobacteraceae bacterium]|nr:nitrate reductase molybdenum cofactor assembly chaperone [Paracoccaceae bacterium]